MMSLMVWLMMCFTVSVSSSAIPCSPMLKDASLVLPSYLSDKTFHRNVIKYKSMRQTVRFDTAGVRNTIPTSVKLYFAVRSVLLL